MADVLQVILNGAATGGLYALLAIGYALVFGTLRFVNFAHGDVCMVGAYLVAGLLAAGLPAWAAFVLGASGAGLLSACLFWRLYRPLLASERIYSLVAAVAVSFLLQHGVQALVSPDALPFPVQGNEHVWSLGGDGPWLRVIDAQVFAIAFFAAAGLWGLTRWTRYGLALRAIASQPSAAALCGVPLERVMASTFWLSGAIATLSSTLQATLMGQMHPTMGLATGLKAFVAAVLGGIDSIWGAWLGGLCLGIAESALIECGYSSSKEACVYGALVLTLLVRPQGLFGRVPITKS